MTKFTFICTFIGLPIMAGEWDGPFWQQALAMVLMMLPLVITVAKGVKSAPTFEEWEEMNHEHRESDGSEPRAV